MLLEILKFGDKLFFAFYSISDSNPVMQFIVLLFNIAMPLLVVKCNYIIQMSNGKPINLCWEMKTSCENTSTRSQGKPRTSLKQSLIVCLIPEDVKLQNDWCCNSQIFTKYLHGYCIGINNKLLHADVGLIAL